MCVYEGRGGGEWRDEWFAASSPEYLTHALTLVYTILE